MQSLDLLAIGEAMAEIRQSTEQDQTVFRVGFAGDTFNTAVYCKRSMGPSGAIGFATRVGSDSLSTEFIATARREALDTSHIAVDETRQIGIYSVNTDNEGERSFAYWRAMSAARNLFASDDQIDLPAARIYYVSGITLAILSPRARLRLTEHLARITGTGTGLVAFDSNYRPGLWESAAVARQAIGDMWDIADIALPSIDDEMALFGDASEAAVASRFFDREWRACAIKRGSRGPLASAMLSGPGNSYAPASTVVDTTAAGDSFNGAYLARLLQGEDERTCLLAGHALASQVVGAPGAIIDRTTHVHASADRNS